MIKNIIIAILILIVGFLIWDDYSFRVKTGEFINKTDRMIGLVLEHLEQEQNFK